MSTKPNTDDTHWFATETAEDWIATSYDRVYFRRGTPRLDADHAVLKAGRKVADAFPEWDIVITYGPYRGYDVQYRVNRQSKSINLDFYSVRPGVQYIDDVIRDIEQALAD